MTMLIPNYGPHKFLPYASDDAVRHSDADQELRPFGVTFFLEDARARMKHIYLSPGLAESFHILDGIEKIDFFLNKNDSRQITSILGGCHKTSHLEAFECVYPHIMRLLSNWCFRYKRPIGIYEIRIIDKRHDAIWGIPFAAPDTLPEIDFPIHLISNTALISLVAIFREGMNSVTSASKFLNYFKILEAYPSQGPFMELGKFCKTQRIDLKRNAPVATMELMEGAFAAEYHGKFIGKRVTWCRDQLSDLRNAVAHPFLRGGLYINLDAVENQAQLSAYANLVERLAIVVLEEEFHLWGSLTGNPSYAAVAKSFTG